MNQIQKFLRRFGTLVASRRRVSPPAPLGSPPTSCGGIKGGITPQRTYLHYFAQAEAVVVAMGKDYFMIEVANLRSPDRGAVRIPLVIANGYPPPRIGQALHVDLIVTGVEYPSSLS